MRQKTIRLSDAVRQRLSRETRTRGYRSESALIRDAIAHELGGQDAALSAAEERIAATLERLGREIRRIGTAQQAQLALTDALSRVILLCLPEPPAAVRAGAEADARRRHDTLLRVAAMCMRGDGRAALSELVSDAD